MAEARQVRPEFRQLLEGAQGLGPVDDDPRPTAEAEQLTVGQLGELRRSRGRALRQVP
ncbi:hypothetical protein ABZY05_48890 [Streptomyces canus]|uniref:hypothetical protein n=1 Tax=Streptomyces canus TaxID=58343 RepID=UPI0033AAA6E0